MRLTLRNSKLTPTVGLQRNTRYVVASVFSIALCSLPSVGIRFWVKVMLWVGGDCVRGEKLVPVPWDPILELECSDGLSLLVD